MENNMDNITENNIENNTDIENGKAVEFVTEIEEPGSPAPKRRTSIRDRIIWIVAGMVVLYIFGSGILMLFFTRVLLDIPGLSNSMHFILEYYTSTLASIVFLIIFLVITPRKNGIVLRSLLPADKDGNKSFNFRLLGTGLLLGFLTNFFCILCALIHGDIKLVYDFSLSQIPVMLFALLSVFIQSSSEELWCRGYMYERINVHYPLWVAVAVNGILFGLLHCFNTGVTPLAIFDIVICGISYSLIKWYTGSIWTAMGLHTAWNFTQNFLFGLPNSGLVSETSVFHLGAANGTSNLIYDYTFGVEGALPGVFIDALLGVIVLYLAYRNGRLGELSLSKEKSAELNLAQQ